MEVIEALSLFPALTVMIFIRRKIGYRMLKPEWLAIMMIVMIDHADDDHHV